MLLCKLACLLLALLVALGWVGIIVLLIVKEEWQLVLVAWLLLYAAGHFCYWYCGKHGSHQPGTTVRTGHTYQHHGEYWSHHRVDSVIEG